MMKRFIITFLVLVLLCLCGCTNQSETILKPVNFYYHNNLSSDENFDQIIVAEIREGAQHSNEELIAQYLRGPNSDELENPFPKDISLVSITVDAKRVIITVSPSFSQLSGIDMTLACGCLGTTIFDLYDCQTVEIISEGLFVNGKSAIVLQREDLVFFDSSYVSKSE